MQRQGVNFKNCIEVGSTDAILEMIKVGMGIALQPDWVSSRNADPALVAKPLKNARFVRQWAYVRPKQNKPSSIDRTFFELCKKTCDRVKPIKTALTSAAAAVAIACLTDYMELIYIQ